MKVIRGYKVGSDEGDQRVQSGAMMQVITGYNMQL